jgi:hypothetical protein
MATVLVRRRWNAPETSRVRVEALWDLFCREGPPPHDLLVCILPADNPEALYEILRAKVLKR